jgi:DNA anti-recombination protein RmuC
LPREGTAIASPNATGISSATSPPFAAGEKDGTMSVPTHNANAPIAALAALLAFASACDDTVDGAAKDATELESKAEKQVDRAGRAVEVESTSFKRSANESLAKIDAKLAEIQKRTESASDEVKEKTKSEVEDLKRQRDALAQKIRETSAEADSDWERTKRSLDESIAELGRDADGVLDRLGDQMRKATE